MPPYATMEAPPLLHTIRSRKRMLGQLQLSHYLDIAEGQNALLFWALNMKTLSPLLAIRVLAGPASSATVERVFSHGGIILPPHRAQMTDYWPIWSFANEIRHRALTYKKCNPVHCYVHVFVMFSHVHTRTHLNTQTV